MVSKIEGNTVYLNNKYMDLVGKYGDENINRYIDFYQAVPIEVRKIFSLLHFELNKLLKYLNGRLRNGHYTAHESRELLYLIEEIRTVQSVVKGTDLDFELKEDCQKKLEECEGFLQDSGGSPIPSGFERVNVIENEPIFTLRNGISVPNKTQMTYYPTKVIGGGSYATVHKYKDEYYNLNFAIKKAMKNLTEKELERFKIEFEEMKKLQSPYVIEVYKYDEENHQYIMEYADETIESFIKKNNTKLSVNERIGLISQILKAFIYINRKGVLHRDISVKNVLVKKYDELNVIKVSDFGLVKRINSTLTNTNTEFKGSLNDPRLEVTGFKNYEIRHETYALTRLIYFVMTGRLTLGSFRSKEFELFIQKGISENIDERYGSIEEIREAFMKIIKTL
ncbi:protein kinase domain-containing protein [Lysinibacillus boronitolerans]|uniref:protein kinase domain-containing protein n=1 Tax=Lysinibacillus boronitolerans TaxID=309788 RepID=UPI0028A223F4|nr:protein kinase [Lysinibacillus boronitolerans]